MFLRLLDFLLRLAVHFAQDHEEFFDCFGWLPLELVWCPSEFFAQAESCEGWMWFASSDCSDKKR